MLTGAKPAGVLNICAPRSRITLSAVWGRNSSPGWYSVSQLCKVKFLVATYKKVKKKQVNLMSVIDFT